MMITCIGCSVWVQPIAFNKQTLNCTTCFESTKWNRCNLIQTTWLSYTTPDSFIFFCRRDKMQGAPLVINGEIVRRPPPAQRAPSRRHESNEDYNSEYHQLLYHVM